MTPFLSLPLRVRFAVPLKGEGEWSVFMKRETEKPLDERRIVDYLDGLYRGGIFDRRRSTRCSKATPLSLPAKQAETPPPAGGGRRGFDAVDYV